MCPNPRSTVTGRSIAHPSTRSGIATELLISGYLILLKRSLSRPVPTSVALGRQPRVQGTDTLLEPLGEELALRWIEPGEHLLLHLLDGGVADREDPASLVREARRVDATVVRMRSLRMSPFSSRAFSTSIIACGVM